VRVVALQCAEDFLRDLVERLSVVALRGTDRNAIGNLVARNSGWRGDDNRVALAISRHLPIGRVGDAEPGLVQLAHSARQTNVGGPGLITQRSAAASLPLRNFPRAIGMNLERILANLLVLRTVEDILFGRESGDDFLYALGAVARVGVIGEELRHAASALLFEL